MTTAIVWLRQDLRLLDNPALTASLAEGGAVLPVYILPEDLGGAARWWLHGSLTALAASLAERGGTLLLRRGDPAETLAALARETGAAAVHATTAAEPAFRAADAAVARALQRLGVSYTLHRQTLFDPGTVRTRTGGIYGMFTPYANAVRALGEPPPPLPEPARVPAQARLPASDRLEDWALLPARPNWAASFGTLWMPGEAAARARGRAFLKAAVGAYETGRNLPGIEGTSRLSPHLHWGEMSARALWHGLRKIPPGAGVRTFETELIWRDFAFYLLWHHPQLAERNLRPDFDRLPWRTDAPGLRAWQRGQTGVPIVDAGMRQLWQLGWMHNRVRMIVASFLVKHLLIDWREGTAWFMDTLVDADLAANSMNWQWAAGTGIDSQPFFRIFNPVSQGEKFDADGAYVRRFVPELARLPDRFLHSPWTAPEDVLRAAGVVPGKTYPAPIVDLAAGRERALAAYRATVRAPAGA